MLSRLAGSTQSLMASDRMLRGRSPWGLEGAVYLLVRSFVRICLFVDVRSSMLLIGGQGTLNSVYIREDYTGLE